MDMLTQTNDIFFTRTGLDPDRAEAIVRDALASADDGELFMEMRHAETLLFDDGRLKLHYSDSTYKPGGGFDSRFRHLLA